MLLASKIVDIFFFGVAESFFFFYVSVMIVYELDAHNKKKIKYS